MLMTVQRGYGACHWLCPSRTPSSNDDVQDMGLHHDVSSFDIHGGLQTRPLHESPVRRAAL